MQVQANQSDRFRFGDSGLLRRAERRAWCRAFAAD
jgi:hypothetical protein